jgi:hypothetical protein
LKALDTGNANQVSIRTLGNAGGATPELNTKLGAQRSEKMDRGVCEAVCGGQSTMVEADEVTALLRAGAKDTR